MVQFQWNMTNCTTEICRTYFFVGLKTVVDVPDVWAALSPLKMGTLFEGRLEKTENVRLVMKQRGFSLAYLLKCFEDFPVSQLFNFWVFFLLRSRLVLSQPFFFFWNKERELAIIMGSICVACAICEVVLTKYHSRKLKRLILFIWASLLIWSLSP